MSDPSAALGQPIPRHSAPSGPVVPREMPLAGRGALYRKLAICMLLIGVTFGQRFCVPWGGFQISILAFLAYAALYCLAVSGSLRVNAPGLALYAATIASMIVTLYCGKVFFSPFSFVYLTLIYLVYVCTIDVSRVEYLSYLKFFQKLLVVLALIALAQFVEQLTLGSTFTLFDRISQDFQIAGYNTRPTLNYGSTFYKANAEFFLEPSFLSQYMAVGIIIEILFFGSWRRIVLYGAAMFASFAGTGILLLLLFGVATVIRARRYELLYPIPVLLLLMLVFRDNSFVGAITGRVGEFDSENSSAFMRFIGPNDVLREISFADFGTFLTGMGPGFVEELNRGWLSMAVNFPVTHKVMIEYGILGLVPFMAFVTHRFFAHSRSMILSAALFMMYLGLSGSLLQPHTVFLFYVLVILMPRQPGEAAVPSIAAIPALRRESGGRESGGWRSGPPMRPGARGAS